MIALWIGLYLVVAFVVVMLSIQISKYVDLLDKKTTLSGGFIGGVFLAAVTSLPEVFTSISALFIIPGEASSSMVIGNILGSDLFNAFVLALTFMFTFHHLKSKKVGRTHIVSSITLVIFYALVAYATLAPASWQIIIGIKIGSSAFPEGAGINVISILLLVIYAISVKFMAAPEEEDEKEEDTSPLTVKQIVVRFIIFSILLIGASIGITYITDIVAEGLQLGKTFAGALFLGVATSLPEVSATISLCKLGNTDAAVGNIVGSNTFNFLILVASDLISWNNPVYCYNTQSMLLIVLGAISAIAMAAFICHKVLKKYPEGQEMKTVTKVLYWVALSVIVIAYILFIILSNVL